jgi:hypothetical protein
MSMDEMTHAPTRGGNLMEYECDVDYTKVQSENVMKYEW